MSAAKKTKLDIEPKSDPEVEEDSENTFRHAETIHKEKLQALGIMSASLAHEINNPLNYSLLGLELLKQEGREMLASEFEGVLSDVEDGLLRIKHIVQDLKVYSRKQPESGEKEEFMVSDVIAASIRLISASSHNIQIITTLDTPYRVKGDPSSIIQVVLNLLTNSVDSINRKNASQPGKIDIIGKQSGDWYEIEVVDNGEGVDGETIRKMFTPFFTTKGANKGTGLGMGICREIIENHKGQIDIDSKVGAWTAVTFSLPMAPNH